MSDHSLDHREISQPSMTDCIHIVCDRFEEALLEGQQSRIEDFLTETREPKRSTLLEELLALELAYRRRDGETPEIADYSARFPCDAVTGENSCRIFSKPGVPIWSADGNQILFTSLKERDRRQRLCCISPN